jgi:hydrogenase maturation protein HypF
MELEHAAASVETDELLPFHVQPDTPLQLDLMPAFAEMARLVQQGRVSTGKIARLFHNTLCAAISDAARRLCEATQIETVALSGGVLQNRVLQHQLVQRLRGHGCRVLVHRQVSPNDSGLALGQAWAGVLKLTG